jgi:hypothetical protein
MEVVEITQPGASADDAERVHVTVPQLFPVLEGDPELDRAARGAKKLAFVEVQNLVEGADSRERGLANADRSDFLRFDQRDFHQIAHLLRERRRSAPAGRSAAGDDDPLHGCGGHFALSTGFDAGAGQ